MEEPKWRDPLTVMMAGLTALDTRLADALAYRTARPGAAVGGAEQRSRERLGRVRARA
jgi:hypothetical protein